MLFGLGSYLKIGLIAAVVVAAAGIYWYISHLQNSIKTLQYNNALLESSISQQQDIIVKQREDFAAITRANREIVNVTTQMRDEVEALRNRFNRMDAQGVRRDVGSLAVARPSLVERAVNTGSMNALRCVEIASGAPLTEREINARTRSEINIECPSIANPNWVGDNTDVE